jgi:multidrug efflux pump subunit AcrA (membrane-fusion protein)
MSENIEHYNLDDEPLPEGEEAPPPYVRTMAIVRWGILVALSIFALIMVLSAIGLTPAASTSDNAIQYHCPMHPTYISNQPGDCPICGMSLVPIDDTSKETAVADTTYPMHDETPTTAAETGQYYCTMCPEVVSDTPGECPKCGMDLVQMREEPAQHTGHESAKTDESPVPGLVPVTIAPERLQLIGIRTAKVEYQSLDNPLRLAGYINYDETKTANIHVRTNGWVTNLYVNQTGQYIKKNELLFSLYSQDLYQAEQDYIAAYSVMPGGETDSLLVDMRQKLLLAAKERLLLLGLSENEIAQIEKSKAATPEIGIRSPFSGYVLDKSILEGQFVSPEQTLFTIADLSGVWLTADVYEKDITLIKRGADVQANIASYPDELFQGTIDFIYPVVSEKTRTLKIRIAIPNSSMKLRPGMYAEVVINPDGANLLTIPTSALINAGEMQYAFIVHGGVHFEPRLLKIGQTSDDWVEVISGLSDGDEVVTSANFLIDSESRLKAAIAGMGGAQAGEHAGHGK